MEEEKKEGKVLHIVMFPWLAIGHLKPFFQLSKILARKGHQISFISSPRNLQRVAKVPQDLRDLINLISFPLPRVENLPKYAESSMDVTSYGEQQLLKIAIDLLQPSVCSFLENAKPKPDWIVYDYASHWLPQLADEIGISKVFFSLFTAAFMAFLGPPTALMSPENGRSTAEDYTVVPDWIPFPTNVVYRAYELTKNMERDETDSDYDSGTSDPIRFGLSINGSNVVIFRSCIEFEPEWFDVIRQIYQKPVIPIGFLQMEEDADECDVNEEWLKIRDWLDEQKANSLVYVALGTEATLSHKESHELALGLEQCNLPFLWVLNRNYHSEILPTGFIERVKNRGMVYTKWAPQIKILGHPAVGGFLTHCGWNSVTEALSFGRVLILFPVMNDQGLNARLLKEKNVGIEIPRNEEDGSFTSDSVAESVTLALVSEEGKTIRENANRMKDLFGDKSRSNSYIDSFISYMVKDQTGLNVNAPLVKTNDLPSFQAVFD